MDAYRNTSSKTKDAISEIRKITRHLFIFNRFTGGCMALFVKDKMNNL